MPIVSRADCPPELLSSAVQAFGPDPGDNLATVEDLLSRYPSDPRLEFLRGSLLAGLERYTEARAGLERALALDPTYAIARFQLGFLELTSGRAEAARDIWLPLKRQSIDDPLHLFVQGLEHLIEDDFPEAKRLLRDGIRRNTALPPLNGDMAKIVAKIEDLEAAGASASESVSAAHLLLRRYKPDGSSTH